jgi:hypothetical protein
LERIMQTAPPPDALSLSAAARLMRVDGKSPSPVTLWRWVRQGKGGVRLAAWPRGRKLCTTPEAVRQFEAEVAAADARRWADRSHDPATDERSRDVEREAAAMGI